jgi:hypothetical protein
MTHASIAASAVAATASTSSLPILHLPKSTAMKVVKVLRVLGGRHRAHAFLEFWIAAPAAPVARGLRKRVACSFSLVSGVQRFEPTRLTT